MTEAEWLKCAEPRRMLEFMRDKASDRKWRLVVCKLALLDHTIRRTDLSNALQSVELGEQWADGEVSDEEVAAFCRATCTEPGLGVWVSLHSPAVESVETFLNGPPGRAAGLPFLFREIFGNPFRPLACDPAWLTSTVVALAEGIYADRAFDRMPILADALQDAGCDNEDTLTHCRDTQRTHVRGCWVIDLLTGRG
jgi:hypothetical protein